MIKKATAVGADDGCNGRAGPGAVDVGEGRTIGGRCRLVERLGHGGMGTVWPARDEMVRRDVAIKEPRFPDEYSDIQRQRFFARMLREERSLAGVVHPDVVALHDVVTEGGQPWLVMELVRGRSLADLLEEGTLASPEAARIGLAVVDAPAAAHTGGVLHRNIPGPGPDMRGPGPARPGAGRARACRRGSTPVTPPMPDPAEVRSGPSPVPAG
ncbi:serine/threonine-protein kinase [Streptomyces sp. NPDC059832]|uniref:serine/threonine-protein kinase n=1 Tax=Streptomyces sp. NPDC059832 TaxID=3346966 RepID=UPI0036465169